MKQLLAATALLLLTGCIGHPETVVPVSGFELQRYLGKWYEIARLDHAFERGLQEVTAEYSLRPDGSLKVINRGFASDDGAWQQAEGRALFVREPDEGHLKVSFFGPFYGSYVIFELDKTDYQYAFVSGADHDYLWLLARTPIISDDLKARFIAQASALGFDTAALIWVQHRQSGPAHAGRDSPAG